MICYLAEVANVDQLLRDVNKRPSFEWGETFVTMSNNALQLYTNGTFKPVDVTLFYYKQPRRIEILGVVNPYTGVPPAAEVTSEFKDDLIEVFIDETVKILAGDIESMNQYQRMSQSTEQTN
jgi:hypothetical protein